MSPRCRAEEREASFDPALSHLQKERSCCNLAGEELSVKRARLPRGSHVITVEFSRWLSHRTPLCKNGKGELSFHWTTQFLDGLGFAGVRSGLLGTSWGRTFTPHSHLWICRAQVIQTSRVPYFHEIFFFSICSAAAAAEQQRWLSVGCKLFLSELRVKISGCCRICCSPWDDENVKLCVCVHARIWGSTEAPAPLCNALFFVTLIITPKREALQRD